jgi:hypothetical protein
MNWAVRGEGTSMRGGRGEAAAPRRGVCTSLLGFCGALLLGCGSAATETGDGKTDVSEGDDAISFDEIVGAPSRLENEHPFSDPTGSFATHSTKGFIDLENEFFQSLGSNGRRCVTCHQPTDAWGIAAEHVRARFEATDGTDPIFRVNDGAVSPNADVSTVAARRAAYAMLLSKGLLRIGLPIPDGAEFELVSVDDPYGFASATELSLFRRPLPTTNLTFLTTVMWDGREMFAGETMHFNLGHQANSATTQHAKGAALSEAQRTAIVDFEMSLFTAQIFDNEAGNLTIRGARGGPVFLSTQEFWPGINAVPNDVRTATPHRDEAFTIFEAWANVQGENSDEARQKVARGEAIFNTHRLTIRNVPGINDDPALGSPTTFEGTCTTCHTSPNAGSNSEGGFFDIGTTGATRRPADMPLYTLRNLSTQEVRQTTDPGRAIVTGKWSDIGRLKVPILRGLAARAPYFHGGSMPTLARLVDFYDGRFDMELTDQEEADLEAYLRSL